MYPRSIVLTATVIITALASGVAVSAQDQPASTTPQAKAALDPTVDKVLTRLERREVHDLRAKLVWKRQYVVEEDEDAVVKTGEIWYQKAEPVAKFLIDFEKRVTGNRKRDLDETHLFDGRWYVERQGKTKSIIRREVRRENDPGDPYKIGEGPFPVPFGQKKADILKEFEATLVPAAADDPPDTDHLRLVPRAGTHTGQRYKTLDFWVAREGKHAGLPIKVVAGKKDGTGAVNSMLTISFSEIRLDQGFSTNIFKIETPRGWNEKIERLKQIEPPPTNEKQTNRP